MSTLTSHLVTRDPARAASWYESVLGATENSRITLPGGQILTIELQFGDSVLAISGEFPESGIVSPLTLGGTYGELHLDRKSTRLNSSHLGISYAVFCLKKKTH